MRRKILSVSILLALSIPAFAKGIDNSTNVDASVAPVAYATPNIKEIGNPHYVQIMKEMAAKMVTRVNELKDFAANPDFFFYKDGKKYIEINGINFEIDEQYGTPILPFRNFGDDSATRSLFGFFDKNWEFSWFDGGVVVANTQWGNYDWGNGCVLEYLPSGHLNTNFVLSEAMSCFDGSETSVVASDATYIAPYKFGVNVEYANMVSIEQLGDKLIVAQSPAPENSANDVPMVGIYDKKANTTTKILGISKAQPYTGLDDLRSYGSQLFVSAIAADGRIDVFNGDTNKYEYSYAVAHNGMGKIAVNDKYIFVADDDKISVYHNQAAEFGEIKQIQPFAYLAYAHGRPLSLEFVGSALLAGGSNGSAVYDLSALSKDVTLQPKVKDLGGFEAMDANEKYIFVKENNGEYNASTTRFAMYDIQKFIANGYQFNDAEKSVYLIDNFWVSGIDLVIADNEIISLSNSIIETVKFEKLDTLEFTPNAYVPTAQLNFDELPTGSIVQKVLQDGLVEGIESISVNTASIVNIRVLNRDQVEITNYTEVDIQGLDLDIRAHSQHSWVRLANLDKLPAYTRIIVPITALNVDKSFNTVDGSGVYNYTKMMSSLEGQGNTYGHYGTLHLIDSRFTTQTKHPLLDKLMKISATWDIEFTNQLITNPTTEKAWDAKSVKRHIELLSNVAFIVSSETFKDKLMNYKETYGHHMYLYGITFNTKELSESLLDKTLNSNAFTNFRKETGFQTVFGMSHDAGTAFGLSDAELDKIESGNMEDFGIYLGEQFGNNWYPDCPPRPCDWTEREFAKLFVDAYNELSEAGELPY